MSSGGARATAPERGVAWRGGRAPGRLGGPGAILAVPLTVSFVIVLAEIEQTRPSP